MEKTLTFTVTDALLSPISLSILSGAGLFKATDETKIHVHVTSYANIDVVTEGGAKTIDLTNAIPNDSELDTNINCTFVCGADKDGSLNGTLYTIESIAGNKITLNAEASTAAADGDSVFVDFYVLKKSAKVSELQIDAKSFGGNFYVEASTLFRDEDGVDHPAEITIPNVKVQSNFTFSMASTGDPSTFDFTMDAMPGYTLFDNTKKVMCVIQVVEDTIGGSEVFDTVMGTEFRA